MEKKVSILGTEYLIAYRTEEEWPKFKTMNASGMAELYSKELVINKDDMVEEEQTFDNLREYELKVLRHEMVHAFLFESGMTDYYDDERLVDWIAVQIPKMVKAMREVECL